MTIFTFRTRVFAAALISISVVACSPSPHDGTTPTPAARLETSNDTDVFKLYDPAALVEVHNFDDLPEAVRALANDSYMKVRLDGSPAKFLVGGVSASSAIVAYEQFGFVPSFRAQAYVYSQARWISGRQWDIGWGITDLKNLISVTSSAR